MAGTTLRRLQAKELVSEAIRSHVAHYKLRAPLAPVDRLVQDQSSEPGFNQNSLPAN